MIGCCVELHGLANGRSCYNGTRGRIIERGTTCAVVQTDGRGINIRVRTRQMCSVFCVGLPEECRLAVRHGMLDECSLARALDKTDSLKFYVLYLGQKDDDNGDRWQHFARVRVPLFASAMKLIAEQDREALLRVYIASYSQDDPHAGIIFGDTMTSPSNAPAFADLSSEEAEQLSMLMSSPLDMQVKNLERELLRHSNVAQTSRG